MPKENCDLCVCEQGTEKQSVRSAARFEKEEGREKDRRFVSQSLTKKQKQKNLQQTSSRKEKNVLWQRSQRMVSAAQSWRLARDSPPIRVFSMDQHANLRSLQPPAGPPEDRPAGGGRKSRLCRTEPHDVRIRDPLPGGERLILPLDPGLLRERRHLYVGAVRGYMYGLCVCIWFMWLPFDWFRFVIFLKITSLASGVRVNLSHWSEVNLYIFAPTQFICRQKCTDFGGKTSVSRYICFYSSRQDKYDRVHIITLTSH